MRSSIPRPRCRTPASTTARPTARAASGRASMFEAPGKPPAKIASLYRLDPDLSCHRMVEGDRLLERPRLESRQPDHVLHRQPHQPRLGLGLRPGDRRYRQPARLHRPDRRGLHRRRRNRRRGRLLLADRAVQGQGPRLRSGGQADADDRHADRSADLLRVRRRRSRYALRHLGDASPEARGPRRTSRRPGGLFAITGLGAKGLPLVPFRG